MASLLIAKTPIGTPLQWLLTDLDTKCADHSAVSYLLTKRQLDARQADAPARSLRRGRHKAWFMQL